MNEVTMTGRRPFGRIDPKYDLFGRINIYRLDEGLFNQIYRLGEDNSTKKPFGQYKNAYTLYTLNN
jgi:hypothetical protein